MVADGGGIRSVVFFVKQKTAYERRISDRSSDVCSSDLGEGELLFRRLREGEGLTRLLQFFVLRPAEPAVVRLAREADGHGIDHVGADPPSVEQDRKSVGEVRRVLVRVDLGGRSVIKKKKENEQGEDEVQITIKKK